MRRLALLVALVATLAAAVPAHARFADGPTATGSILLDRLDTPAGVTASSVARTATITWQPIADAYGQGYRLYRSSIAGAGHTLVRTVTPISASSTTDTPPLPGVYYYIVRAFAGEWMSPPSSEVSVVLL